LARLRFELREGSRGALPEEGLDRPGQQERQERMGGKACSSV